MTLEAQLLTIIEQQQQQLKEQQEQQQKAFQLIEQQGRTIKELESYTKTLTEKHSEAVTIVRKYQQMVRQLSEQTISPHFSTKLHETLECQLHERLSELVTSLSLDLEVKQLIRKELPTLAQIEIEKQLKPMSEKITERMHSVEQYQQKLAELIQQVSSRL